MNKNSFGYILGMIVTLSLVCSAMVSIAAIGLRDKQLANIALERNANLLAAAGLLDMTQADAKTQVAQLIQRVETKVVDLRTGEFTDAVDAASYEQLAASKDPALSAALTRKQDKASIQRLEYYGNVYIARTTDGAVDSLIFPIRGYGLWSTLYGFMALEPNFEHVRGLGFYQHGETPGLGGEVDNPRWKALWQGKTAVGEQGKVVIQVVKNPVPGSPDYAHQVDALSGASLTSRGVNNLIQFWLGQSGYGKFLDKLRNQELLL